MPYPAGDITILDSFTRADGNVWAGAGATLWDTVSYDGSGSAGRVVSNTLKMDSGGGTALTNESLSDFIRIVRISADGLNVDKWLAFRITTPGASCDGYLVSIQGSTWTMYRIDNGSFTSLGAQPATSLSVGAYVALSAVGDTFELRVGFTGTGGSFPVFDDDPLCTWTDATYAGPGQFGIGAANANWGFDDYSEGGLVAPSSGVTIYVDPDHPDASDSYSRTQASDPDTPYRTVQGAGWVARAGVAWHDTILVSPCVTEDLGDAQDPHLQPALDYRSTDRSPTAVGWPMGDNEGNEPILIKGNAGETTIDDLNEYLEANGSLDGAPGLTVLPKIRLFGSRGLNNWIVEDLQFGYDVGSGDDYLTLSYMERVTDLTYRRCLFTGGLGIAQFWEGEFRVENCYVRAPLSPGQIGVHDGAGLRMEGAPGEGSGFEFGDIYVLGTTFEGIEGDDALTPGSAHVMLVQDCTFINVLEGNPSFHTDGIQILGVEDCTVDRCVFVGCSTPFIASDGHNNLITLTSNLFVGSNVCITIQGTDEVRIEQNTCYHAETESKDASLLFYDRFALPDDTVATIRNNIIGGFFMRDRGISTYFGPGTVIENNIVMTDPGQVTAWGTNLPGIAEFGHSARLDTIPNDTVTFGVMQRSWELANSPTPSSGIGEGVTTTVTEDLFGRAYASPPDLGALQSDPGTLVTPVARPPYVISRSPAVGETGVSPSVSVTADLYPVPGNEIDPVTVTTGSALVRDVYGIALPAVVTLGDLDVNGRQRVTIDVKSSLSPVTEGTLYPAVAYTAVLTGDVADTDGSELVALSWSFLIAGPPGGAVSSITGDDFSEDAPQIYSITSRKGTRLVVTHTEVRFPAQTPLFVWEVTEDREITGDVVASGTVSADFSVVFTGLEVGTYYVAGPGITGPFTLFRVYA